jgi:hypothetical protein
MRAIFISFQCDLKPGSDGDAQEQEQVEETFGQTPSINSFLADSSSLAESIKSGLIDFVVTTC